MERLSGGEVLVMNAGSTSLKLHLVDEREHSRQLDERDGLRRLNRGAVAAVAHRVVHGGERFCGDPVLIDGRVREQIFALEELAPLHNAPALRGIELASAALPDTPQVAVFDTAFHRTIPEHARTYALPRRWREEWGVRRYGFHGLSVQWCAERAAQLLGSAGPRLVVCHLGGGCSVSAVREGRSLDTTMGFSPLEGVPMATRSGSVDPGALLYVLRTRKLSVKEMEHELNLDAGLRGVGGSGDVRQLESAASTGDPDARLALELFCHRVAGAVASMAVAAGGVDALAFTAGIGEHSALVRERVCEWLRFLGVRLDGERNAQRASQDRDVAVHDSAVRVLVVHAREEVIAARAARRLLARTGRPKPPANAPPGHRRGRAPRKDRPAGGSGPIRGRE